MALRSVDRTAMVPYSAEQMYALVDDVEIYPEFLPWCTGSKLKSRETEELVASLEIGYCQREILPPLDIRIESNRIGPQYGY